MQALSSNLKVWLKSIWSVETNYKLQTTNYNMGKIMNYCLPEKHVFENGGRDILLNLSGLSEKNLTKIIKDDWRLVY